MTARRRTRRSRRAASRSPRSRRSTSTAPTSGCATRSAITFESCSWRWATTVCRRPSMRRKPARQKDRDMKFRGKILQAGKTATGIEVPAKVVAALGSSKRPPVRATINGYTYRSTVAVMGGKFMLGVSNEVRSSAGVAAGDTVDIDLELDTEAREVELPPDFAAALARDAKAKKFFEGLSYSKKLRLVIPIGVKDVETRKQRIAKTVGQLREGRA